MKAGWVFPELGRSYPGDDHWHLRAYQPEGNKLWALVLGLQLAHKIGANAVEHETEASEALREWSDCRWFVDPRHSGVVQQHIQRTRDPTLVLRRRVVVESQKRVARFLAEDGVATKTRAVRVYRSFGRVSELWHLDIGLGFIGGGFMVIDEDEYLAQQQQEEEWLEDAVEGEDEEERLEMVTPANDL
ncbi:hypothetical protein ACET3Z_004744 [Daucus carota]